MSQSSPSKRSLPAIIGGAVLVLVAGYFGIDLGSSSDGADQKAAPSSAAGASAESGVSDREEGDVAKQGESDLPSCAMDSLPQQAKNYYREYTVETPGIGHRGAKRIVTGGGSETDPDVWYYTDDHYESFCSIPDAED